jgi:pyruvate dehydrogenase E2 component (dihydrolipoamide acetyltransferase)
VLAVGAVREAPVVAAGTLVAGTVISVTLSIDQQVADAVLAARWMRALVSLLEHPVRFLA